MLYSFLFLQHASYVRTIFFGTTLLILIAAEKLLQRRSLQLSKTKRWFCNLSMVALNNLLIRLLLPALLVEKAALAEKHQIGLFHYFQIPFWLNILLSLCCLDFIIYVQHIAFHKIAILWRFHKVHHVDLDLDWTTGIRFHPVEILISLGIKLAAVYSLGVSPQGIVIFQIILNLVSMFNHSNIQLPLWCDQFLRMLIVTPDMHLVHHSTLIEESNSNFGFNLSIWDKLCATYRPFPKRGIAGTVIGTTKENNAKYSKEILTALWLPFE